MKIKRAILLVTPSMVGEVQALLPAGVHIVGSASNFGPIALILEGENVPRAQHVTIVVRKHRRGMSASLRCVPAPKKVTGHAC